MVYPTAFIPIVLRISKVRAALMSQDNAMVPYEFLSIFISGSVF